MNDDTILQDMKVSGEVSYFSGTEFDKSMDGVIWSIFPGHYKGKNEEVLIINQSFTLYW